MIQQDVGAYIKPQVGIDPEDSAGATINGVGIGRQGFLSCVLHHAVGAVTGTPTSFSADAKLQDSATVGGTYVDFGAAAAQLVADDTEADVNIDLTTAKQFIRVVEVTAFVGGTSPTIPVSAIVILGGPDTTPV